MTNFFFKYLLLFLQNQLKFLTNVDQDFIFWWHETTPRSKCQSLVFNFHPSFKNSKPTKFHPKTSPKTKSIRICLVCTPKLIIITKDIN